ncbi:acyl-CoA dehydrogenase family protein, partial [Streptomyces sp. NPDC059083]|uniref:acyl-CoA dehydrogenase family protein n=1 Tax=Streptomyces sp. NPDC059083 TaxID=3346721 RepID=UPI00369CA0E5
IQLAAALEQIVAWTLEYAAQRQQFGRTLDHFQSVQHAVASMVGETASAAAIVDNVLRAETPPPFAGLTALVRASEAAATVARVAHQIHGAIGFTREHRLHLLTTLVWSWRDECGPDRALAAALGRALSESDLWSQLLTLSTEGLPQ